MSFTISHSVSYWLKKVFKVYKALRSLTTFDKQTRIRSIGIGSIYEVFAIDNPSRNVARNCLCNLLPASSRVSPHPNLTDPYY